MRAKQNIRAALFQASKFDTPCDAQNEQDRNTTNTD